jgi:hypothetical protein
VNLEFSRILTTKSWLLSSFLIGLTETRRAKLAIEQAQAELPRAVAVADAA